MVLRFAEQNYLLIMLENNREFPNELPRPKRFYEIMASMVKKQLVSIHERKKKSKLYRLTNYGWAIACCIAKDYDTEPKYLKYAREVELWIL